MADKTLFWPHDNDKGYTWPNLKRLNVMIHICSPSGSWYFQDPPGIEHIVADRSGSEETYPPFPNSEERTHRIQRIKNSVGLYCDNREHFDRKSAHLTHCTCRREPRTPSGVDCKGCESHAQAKESNALGTTFSRRRVRIYNCQLRTWW
jgi:hypothetical protein